ncbi:MAG TPA: hypothetical protein DCG63_07290, partial [Methylophilaceae bacterium]|nr:hypothetical protein [Methylophilaceae bacterium]
LANGTAPKGGTLIASANDLVISKHANALVNGFTFGQSLNGDFKSSMGTDFLAQGFNNIT